MIESGIQKLLRGAAARLASLADQVDDLQPETDPDWSAKSFAGIDFVGIDFSTSIAPIADHVIRGWDRYRAQMDALRPDHGIWAFGVNSLPFPLTRRPISPAKLPSLRVEHFERRGHGRGLIEIGSAFYDYFRVMLEYAEEMRGLEAGQTGVPITISLLCDGFPNGGLYRADDVRPLVEAAQDPRHSLQTRGVSAAKTLALDPEVQRIDRPCRR